MNENEVSGVGGSDCPSDKLPTEELLLLLLSEGLEVSSCDTSNLTMDCRCSLESTVSEDRELQTETINYLARLMYRRKFNKVYTPINQTTYLMPESLTSSCFFLLFSIMSSLPSICNLSR